MALVNLIFTQLGSVPQGVIFRIVFMPKIVQNVWGGVNMEIKVFQDY